MTSEQIISRSIDEQEQNLKDNVMTIAPNLVNEHHTEEKVISVHSKLSLSDHGLFEEEANTNDDESIEDESSLDLSFPNKREKMCKSFFRCIIS